MKNNKMIKHYINELEIEEIKKSEEYKKLEDFYNTLMNQ
jgi:hypothetical protein